MNVVASTSEAECPWSDQAMPGSGQGSVFHWMLAAVAMAILLSPAVSAALPTTASEGHTWTTGLYTYDGVGNIIGIGPHSNQRTDYYVYDRVNRLVRANAHTDTHRNEQEFQYDEFGNIRSTVSTSLPDGGAPQTETRHFDPDLSTNRLRAMPGCGGLPNCVSYDPAGNLTSGPALVTYEWDALGMMTERHAPDQTIRHVYDAANERIAVVTLSGSSDIRRYTLRNPANKVVREAIDTVANGLHSWTWSKDYIYRSGQLLSAAASNPDGTESRTHFHLDHVGTPRLITDDGGRRLAEHTYWPFGEQAPGSAYDNERMKLTGHERDFGMTASEDLDYMHARFYMPLTGRFVSPDRERGTPAFPLTLNRYAYGANSPLRYIDPDGNAIKPYEAMARLYGATARFFERDAVASLLPPGMAEGGASTARLMEKTLRLGDATGEALGSKSDGHDLAMAISQDVATASEFFVTAAAPVEGHLQRPVMLGKNPRYVEAARELSARALNVNKKVWDFIGKTKVGEKILERVTNGNIDAAIQRGARIFTSNDPTKATGGFLEEMKHLAKKGYKTITKTGDGLWEITK